MKDVRILKIKRINQNTLRQLVDVEELFRYGIPALAFFIAFILTPQLNLQVRVIVVGMIGIFCWAILSHEVDRQPAYTLILPYLQFMFNSKKLTKLKEINFDVVDNLLIFKERIVVVFKLEPVDIMLLSEQDRQIFIKSIQNFLNNQRGIHIQILMRNRGADQSDYMKHFNNITSQQVSLHSKEMGNLRENKLAGYVEDMQVLLSKNIVPIRDYFILFEIKGNTSTSRKTIELIRKLEELSERMGNLLDQSKIRTNQLRDEKLEEFLQSFIRQI
jgi:hypothetical protein